MLKPLYYKGAVNSDGEASIIDPVAQTRISRVTFTVDEANMLTLQDCRPVILQVVRAFRVRSDVIPTEETI